MKYKIILPLLLLPFFLNAQIIKERDVIASGGNSFSSGNLKVDYTIGQLSVRSVASGNLELTEGFLQPAGMFIGIGEEEAFKDIRIFPNPVSSRLTISISAASETIWNCHITDMLGRVLPGSRAMINGKTAMEVFIDCSKYPQGAYLIHFQSEEPRQSFTYKLIKTR